MLIFSDLHLRDESADLVLCSILPQILEAADVHHQDVIACLGDVLHFRYRVPAPLLNGLRDWCLDVTATGKRIFLLPGNHDQYDATGRNALEPLGSIEGVEVFTEPTLNKYGLWIPYRLDPEAVKAAMAEVTATGAGTIFLHHGIIGAWMNDGVHATEGVPLDTFGQRRVLCGHYHRHHQVGTATYIGSPYQTRADESGQEKGFCLWDGQNLEFHPRRWGKRYHRIHLAQGETLDTAGIDQGDDVRVTTAAGVDPTAIGRELQAQGIETHTVTPEQVAAEQRLDVGAGASLSHFAEAYVRQFGGDLDAGRLMEVYQEVTRG